MRQLLPDPAEDLTDDDLVAAYAVPPGEHLRVNFVSSADGAVTLDGASGGLGGPGDRRVFQLLRDLADVILVAAGTVRNEGYGYPRFPPGAPGPPAGRRPAASGRRSRSSPAAWISTSAPASSPARRSVRSWSPARSPRPTGARSWSGARRCWSSTTCRPRWPSCTGAGRSSARAARTCSPRWSATACVDELCLTLSPILAGPGPGRIEAGPQHPAVRLALAGLLEEDGALFTRYARHPPGRMTGWTCP